jgi:hypothetical protein
LPAKKPKTKVDYAAKKLGVKLPMEEFPIDYTPGIFVYTAGGILEKREQMNAPLARLALFTYVPPFPVSDGAVYAKGVAIMEANVKLLMEYIDNFKDALLDSYEKGKPKGRCLVDLGREFKLERLGNGQELVSVTAAYLDFDPVRACETPGTANGILTSAAEAMKTHLGRLHQEISLYEAVSAGEAMLFLTGRLRPPA